MHPMSPVMKTTNSSGHHDDNEGGDEDSRIGDGKSDIGNDKVREVAVV